MDQVQRPPIERLDDWRVQVGPIPGMKVPGIVYADEEMMRDMIDSMSLQQVVNVAHLPGIVRASLAMPDIHWGYGFPIGGVAAFDPDEGVISPGGVGYDIN
jgi:tRNA-splicing ligase RtcB